MNRAESLALRGIADAQEQNLALEMTEYLGQFVQARPLTGAAGLAWPAFAPQGGSLLRFGVPVGLLEPQNPNCAFLDRVGYARTAR